VQTQLAELAPRIAGHEAGIAEFEQTIATCRARLAGETATQNLAARAAEFAAAEIQMTSLDSRRQQVRENLNHTRQQRDAADDAWRKAERAVEEISSQLQDVLKRLSEKANKPARLQQAERLKSLRRSRRTLPANWLDETANVEIAREWESLAAIDREIHKIERDLAEKAWITDAGILVTRDKLRADAARQGKELAERQRDNRMAEAQTSNTSMSCAPPFAATPAICAPSVKWPASRSKPSCRCWPTTTWRWRRPRCRSSSISTRKASWG
jgi:chromosome segregation ATPase